MLHFHLIAFILPVICDHHINHDLPDLGNQLFAAHVDFCGVTGETALTILRIERIHEPVCDSQHENGIRRTPLHFKELISIDEEDILFFQRVIPAFRLYPDPSGNHEQKQNAPIHPARQRLYAAQRNLKIVLYAVQRIPSLTNANQQICFSLLYKKEIPCAYHSSACLS